MQHHRWPSAPLANAGARLHPTHLAVLRTGCAEPLNSLLHRQPHLAVVAVAVARIELVAADVQHHLPAGAGACSSGASAAVSVWQLRSNRARLRKSAALPSCACLRLQHEAGRQAIPAVHAHARWWLTARPCRRRTGTAPGPWGCPAARCRPGCPAARESSPAAPRARQRRVGGDATQLAGRAPPGTSHCARPGLDPAARQRTW